MKKIATILSLIMLSTLVFGIYSCKKKEQEKEKEESLGEIKGTPGNPRFNLQFTNSAKVDLDIHVLTPNGTEIYYYRPTGQKGQLDLDCLCGDCKNGPNENVFWTPGTAPSGTYKVWVEYYDSCDGGQNSSNYTLRIMNNSNVLNTYTGTLNQGTKKSPVYTLNF